MEKIVYKYGLSPDEISLPKGAKVLRVGVGVQNEAPTLWVEVNPNAPIVTRRVEVVGTGHPVPVGFSHIGTIFSGPFVWHFYLEDE